MTGYHCPMHPNERSPTPGRCRICRMHLVPDEADAMAASTCCSVGHA